MADIIKDENSLEVNGKIYSLTKVPQYTDEMVQEEVKSVINQLSLKDITENLYLTVELFFVAYNGVAGAKGGTIQSEIAAMQSELALLCNHCIVTMTNFKEETQNIISTLVETYKWLTRGRESMALVRLAHCGEASKSMSDSAKELADDFKALQIKSTRARSNTIEQEASERDKKLAAEKAERSLRAKQATEEINKQELLGQIDEMQTQYNEAKEREESESTKALVLGITAAVSSSIGAGLGAFAVTRNPIAQLTNAISMPTTTSNTQLKETQENVQKAKQQSDKAQKNLQETKDNQLKKQNLVDKLTIEIEALNKKISENEKNTDTLSSLNKEKNTKNSELITAKTELQAINEKSTDLEKKSEDYTSAYATAAASLKDLAISTGQMTQEAANAEASIHQEKMHFLNQKLELEKQKRQSLVLLAEYAETLKNLKVEEGIATVSVESLHAAIEALGKIVATLTDASLFWDQMSKYCKNMSTEGFQQMVSDMTNPKSGISSEDRIALYRENDFMRLFLRYMCQWTAINGLSGEYLIEAGKSQKKAVGYLRQSPTIEEALKKAPELAKNIEMMIGKSLSQSGEVIAELEQQKSLITETK